MSSERPAWISPIAVIRIAAALYDIEDNELLSRRRNPRFEAARALVAWSLRAIPAQPMSYPAIGRAMDHRDHSTIINLHANAIRLRLCDQFFARCCTALRLHFGLTQEIDHVRR